VSGGTVRATAGSGITFVHNILAFPSAGTGLSVADGALWEVGWNNLWHPTGAEYGDAIADQTGISGNLHADPLFLLYTADATWNDDLHLRADSPCIDAGDPTRGLDPDGSPPDLGAFGGPDATLWPVIDLDGDGWPDGVLDCDDGRADVHPGAPEECDGVDQDCDGQVDDGCGDDDDDSAVGDDDSAGDDDLVGDDDVGDDDISLRTPETGGCGCEGEDGGAALALPLLLGAFRPKRRHR
jgi:hypothetical protein